MTPDGQAAHLLSESAKDFDEQRFEQREHWRLHILEAITSGAPLTAILDLLALSVEKDDPEVLCSILLADDEGKRLLKGSAPSLPEFFTQAIDGLEIGEGVGACGACAYSRQRVVIFDVLTHPYAVNFRALAKAAGLRSAWSEPILSSKGRLLGTFALYHRAPCVPNEDQIKSIEYCAKLASIVIERKQGEEELLRAKNAAETASKVKSHFIALMSHELRTPLNPVKMILHEWKDDPSFPGKYRADLEVLQLQIDTEIKLISDLLEMQELDYRKMNLSRHLLDAHELLSVSTELVAPDFQQKGVPLTTDFQAQRARVFSDRIRLSQVFFILLNNALKFTESGGSVIVSTRDEGDRLRIDFLDTGTGIKPEDLERIFERFEQGDRGQISGTCGLGLGLSIAKGLIQALGGQIGVQSRGVGLGSTFTLLLDTESEN